jgi:hypothetical protein
MAKVTYSIFTSLYGYAEDGRGGFGWGAPEDEELHSYINELASSFGTYLYGAAQCADEDRAPLKLTWPSLRLGTTQQHYVAATTSGCSTIPFSSVQNHQPNELGHAPCQRRRALDSLSTQCIYINISGINITDDRPRVALVTRR